MLALRLFVLVVGSILLGWVIAAFVLGSGDMASVWVSGFALFVFIVVFFAWGLPRARERARLKLAAAQRQPDSN